MTNEKKIILGLDVSTTTIGICLAVYEDKNLKISKVSYVSPKISKKITGMESLFLKSDIFENEFLSKYKDIGITDVIIEEPLLRSNNITSVVALLRFNSLISRSIYKMLGLIPSYISSYDARAYAFPELIQKRRFSKKGEMYTEAKIRKEKPVLFGDFAFDVDKKIVIFDKISEKYPQITWPLGKDGEPKKEAYDCSDAVCCVLGYISKDLN